MRGREITVIPWTKKEDEVLELHCVLHRSNRMIRLPDPYGLRCSFCGGTKVAIRTIILKDPSSFESSRHSNERSE